MKFTEPNIGSIGNRVLIMLNHRDDKARTYEINDKLSRVLVRKLEAQKRSLLRAIKASVFELEELVPYNKFGEPNEWVVQAVNRLKKTIKKNSSKPKLWS
jgi:hypothetical protein